MISVHQLVSHLDPEAQGAVLVSKDAFLAYLRERYTGLDDSSAQVRRDLNLAARRHLRGEKVSVEARPDEREAGKAVLYAVLRLAERVTTRAAGSGTVTVRDPENREAAQRVLEAVGRTARAMLGTPSAAREYHDPSKRVEGSKPAKRWRSGYGGAAGYVTVADLYPLVHTTVLVTADGEAVARIVHRADRTDALLAELEAGQGRWNRHVAAVAAAINRGARLEHQISHSNAERVALTLLVAAQNLSKRQPRLKAPAWLDREFPLEAQPVPALPDVEAIPEVVETGETAHFEAASRETGYAQILVDGEAVGRVRCWPRSDRERPVDSEWDRVRGGTAERCGKPAGTRALRLGETQALVLERRGRRVNALGRGTTKGELWLCGTADLEVLKLRSRRIKA